MEAADFDRGSKAFASSTHPIDAEHKAVMRECLAGSLQLEPLYDVAVGSTSAEGDADAETR
jgi:hypothetical protein